MTRLKYAGICPICRSSERMLLGLRSDKSSQPRTWACFGGRIETGESPVQAASRELFEETGFTGRITLAEVGRSKDGVYQNYAGLIAEEFDPILNVEHHRARWFEFEEIEEIEQIVHPGLLYLIRRQNMLSLLSSYR